MRKVMIVDDEEYVIDMLKSIIPWEFYEFTIAGCAGNAVDAVKMFYSVRPDLIITDISMQDVSGLEFITRVRMVDPDVDVIILSAYDKFEYAQRALKLRVSRYLLKPLKKEELIEELVSIQRESDQKNSKLNENRLQQYAENYYQGRQVEEELIQVFKGEIAQLPLEEKKELFWCVLCTESIRDHENIFLEQDIKRTKDITCYSYFSDKDDTVFFLCALSKIDIQQCIENLKDKYPISDRGILIGRSEIRRECTYDMCVQSREALRTIFYGGTADNFKLAEKKIWSYPKEEPIKEGKEEVKARLMNHSPEEIRDSIQNWVNLCISRRVSRGSLIEGLNELIEIFEELNLIYIEKSAYEQMKNRLNSAVSVVEVQDLLAEIEEKLNSAELAINKNAMIVEKTNEYIGQMCYEESFSVDDLASRMNLSKSYLSKIYKKVTGDSIWNYVVQLRITRAKELLSTTNATNAAIAHAIGYTSEYHFSRAFSKIAGMPPTTYRKLFIGQL